MVPANGHHLGAHTVVRRARELLSPRVKLLRPDVEFYEILDVGYVQNQKTSSPHDDEKKPGRPLHLYLSDARTSPPAI